MPHTNDRWKIVRNEDGIAALEFAVLAPALLMLAFAIIIYTFYFSAVIGVRQAASEGARAAMAGLGSAERVSLATARAQQVIDGYGVLLSDNGSADVTAQAIGTGVFEVTVSYDISGSPFMRFSGFVPLPEGPIESSVVVTNGSY
jgi:Flp pilus assembly protein TadG